MILPESKREALHMANLARGELARRHARHFFKLIYPTHTINWHHALLLDKLQKFAKGEIKNLIVSMPPQHGKFLAGNTPVLTTNGWKRHDELQIGDYVFSDTGQPVAVLGNSGVYDWHVNKVEFEDGDVIYAANEHLWKVYIEKDEREGYRCAIADTAEIAETKHCRAPYILSNSCLGDRGDKYKFFIKDIQPHSIVSGNCIQVDGGIYLAGESLIPTHNSELCSRMLPAYLLGLHPTKRIISASYNADNSAKFNRDVQRLIDSDAYRLAFPKTRLFAKSVKNSSAGSWLRNRDEFETVEYGGYYKNAGIGGGITGRSADFAIIDDPVKGAADAASAAVRNAIWNWYVQDLGTRLNNGSQQLIIMTRWHEDDLVGRILANPETAKDWEIVTLPAIKENHHNPDDPREIGEALWENFQGIARLRTARALGERAFQCLYQQNPSANKDLLIFPTYEVCESEHYDNVSASEIFGLDFGYNDELALVGTKLKGNDLYQREYIYKRGMTTPMIIEALRSLGVGRRVIVCDNARPEQIDEIKEAGFAAVPCVKGKNSVNDGIAQVQARRLIVTRNSPNIIAELNGYEWLTDALGKATETPAEGRKHHAIDAIRYALKYTLSMRNLGRVRVSEGYIE